MAMYPMQRKANNSFLLGILITLLITGVIIAFLILQISKLNSEMEAASAHTVYAYVVVDTIQSGTDITSDKVQGVEVNLSVAADTSTFYSAQTRDAEGNPAADSAGALLPTGIKAKVDLNPGTILTTDLTYENEPIRNDLRSEEFNVITLPSQLQTGEYIDIRLRMPDGRNVIVVSHKEVTIPNLAGVDSENCIWMDLTEEETLMMSCAIVESYKMNGAKLYATRYVEPGIQEAATVTYVPNDETKALIERDPNIVQEAKNELLTVLNSNSALVRPGINSAINNEDAADNVIEKTEDEITSLKEERELYIESIGG